MIFEVGVGYNATVIPLIVSDDEICGNVIAFDENKSQTHSFNQYTGELTIYTESLELVGTHEIIKISSFVKEYPHIKGVPLIFWINFVPCNPGQMQATFIGDLTHEIGSPETTLNLTPFKASDEASCKARWSYQIETYSKSDLVHSGDYFQFDKTSLKLTLNPKARESAHTFQVKLVGALQSKFTSLQYSTKFNLIFVKPPLIGNGPIPVPYIKSINFEGLVLICFDVGMAIPEKNSTYISMQNGSDTLNLNQTKGPDKKRRLEGTVYEEERVYGRLKEVENLEKDLQSSFDVFLEP